MIQSCTVTGWSVDLESDRPGLFIGRFGRIANGRFGVEGSDVGRTLLNRERKGFPVIALASNAPPPEIGVLPIIVGGALVAVGFVALRRWNNGWSVGATGIRDLGRWGAFLARAGFALLPFQIAAISMLGVLVSVELFATTDFRFFRMLAVLSALAFPVSMAWGLKEYNRPSRWRKTPAWLEEYRRA